MRCCSRRCRDAHRWHSGGRESCSSTRGSVEPPAAVDVLKLLQLHPQRGGLLVLAGSYRDTAYLDRVHPERVEHRLDVQPLRGEQAGRRLDALAPACARRPRGRLGARPGRWWSGGRR